jgi:hypothetical protein
MLKKMWSQLIGKETYTDKVQTIGNLEQVTMHGSEPAAHNPMGNFRKSDHPGKKVFICEGDACNNSGNNEQVKRALLGRYTEEEIGTVECLGSCHSDNSMTGRGDS